MTIYVFLPLVSSLWCFFISLFVFLKRKNSIINTVFFFQGFTVFIWLFGYFLMYVTTDEVLVLKYTKLVYTGVIFIPIAFYHFASVFLGLREKIRNKIVIYSIGIGFLILLYTTNDFVKGFYKSYWGYQTRVGYLHNFYLLFLAILCFISFIRLYKYFRKAKHECSARRYNQIKYVLIAFLIAWFGCFPDFLSNYGIVYYPLGGIFIFLFFSIVSYTILAYRLMQIEVIIKRTAIFAGLFLFVSISFIGSTFLVQEFLSDFLGANGKWAVLVFSMTLITAGMRPLENLLIGLTDKFLFQKKYNYQETLREASDGMTLITDMKKLLNLIVRVVTKNIRVKSAGIFQLDDEKNKYVLKIRRGSNHKHTGYSLDKDSALVWWLKNHKDAILLDEIEEWLRSEKFLRREKGIKEKLAAMKEELSGMDSTICVPSYGKGHLIGFLLLGEKLSGDIYTQEDIHLLSTLASSTSIAIENAKNFMELEKIRERERENYIQTVLALAQTVDEKDSYTHGHLESVCHYGMMVAEELEQLSEFKGRINREDLEIGLKLHDIGKIGIPDAILHKDNKLTPEEWSIMKQHCEIGARIVEPIEKFRNIGNIIRHHQERYDGEGYPDRLKGEEIPLESRIIAVVDSYHAMVSDRPYRKALPDKTALKELKDNIGTQFDPIIVGSFIQAWEKGKIKKL
jgi:hypothetical protein